MPERLSRAAVAACAALAAGVFGGAYALAHDDPAKPAPAPAPPTAIRLADDPVGELHRVSALPALVVPPRHPKPARQSQPTVTAPTPVTPVTPVTPTPAPVTRTPAPAAAPAPARQPAPAPTHRRPAPAKPPVTFDDSG